MRLKFGERFHDLYSKIKASLAAPSPIRDDPHVSILILKNVNGKGGVSV
jgi:hypothetical protein